MNVFDFINSINYDKSSLFDDPLAEKEYNSYIVNKGLSYFPDTVLYANQMNVHSDVPKKWQFDFLKSCIPKKKRFSKWHKKSPLPEDIELIQEYYQYSYKKAVDAMSILTSIEIQNIRDMMLRGGNSKR